MTEYDNTNRGALFKNTKKRDGKKDPDYNGSLNVGGHDYWLSAWLTKDRNGNTFMSVSVQPKDRQISEPPPRKAEQSRKPHHRDDDMDDAIPF